VPEEPNPVGSLAPNALALYRRFFPDGQSDWFRAENDRSASLSAAKRKHHFFTLPLSASAVVVVFFPLSSW
jgi:hypothetical protein